MHLICGRLGEFLNQSRSIVGKKLQSLFHAIKKLSNTCEKNISGLAWHGVLPRPTRSHLSCYSNWPPIPEGFQLYVHEYQFLFHRRCKYHLITTIKMVRLTHTLFRFCNFVVRFLPSKSSKQDSWFNIKKVTLMFVAC